MHEITYFLLNFWGVEAKLNLFFEKVSHNLICVSFLQDQEIQFFIQIVKLFMQIIDLMYFSIQFDSVNFLLTLLFSVYYYVRRWGVWSCAWIVIINPFVPSAPFLYPQKTESLTVFWCFQGVEEGCIGKEWVNESDRLIGLNHYGCKKYGPKEVYFKVKFSLNKTVCIFIYVAYTKLLKVLKNNRKIFLFYLIQIQMNVAFLVGYLHSCLLSR